MIEGKNIYFGSGNIVVRGIFSSVPSVPKKLEFLYVEQGGKIGDCANDCKAKVLSSIGFKCEEKIKSLLHKLDGVNEESLTIPLDEYNLHFKENYKDSVTAIKKVLEKLMH